MTLDQYKAIVRERYPEAIEVYAFGRAAWWIAKEPSEWNLELLSDASLSGLDAWRSAAARVVAQKGGA